MNPSNQKPNQKLRVALVGLGIGRQHALAYKNLSDRFSLQAVCSLDDDASRAAAAEFGARHVLSRFEDVLALPDIDVVDICTPPHLHAPQAEAALRAGKHVICEKPLAASLAVIDALALAERESGKRLMPIFQYRFGGGVQKLQKLVQMGLAGAPLVATVEVHWRRRASYYTVVPWRGKLATELGGVLLSQAIHALDMLMEVVGPARRVYAVTSTRSNDVEIEDCAAISLEMANGALATISATLGSSVEISRHRFVFEKLVAESNTRAYSNGGDPWSYTADTPDQQPAIDAALEAGISLFDGVPAGDGATDGRGLKGIAPPAGFDAQFMLFHEAILHGRPLPVTIADARRATELLSAIYESAETHRAVELH
jgi:predicted dehydrogenase